MPGGGGSRCKIRHLIGAINGKIECIGLHTAPKQSLFGGIAIEGSDAPPRPERGGRRSDPGTEARGLIRAGSEWRPHPIGYGKTTRRLAPLFRPPRRTVRSIRHPFSRAGRRPAGRAAGRRTVRSIRHSFSRFNAGSTVRRASPEARQMVSTVTSVVRPVGRGGTARATPPRPRASRRPPPRYRNPRMHSEPRSTAATGGRRPGAVDASFIGLSAFHRARRDSSSSRSPLVPGLFARASSSGAACWG